MAQLFKNNATGSLSAAITNVATTLTLQAGQGALFPALTGGNTFVITLVGLTSSIETSWEIVQVTALTGDTMTIVRAQEGSAAVAWPVSTPVGLRLTAAVAQAAASAQATLVSGTNIRTVNGNSLLGSTDVAVGYLNIPQNSQSVAYTTVLSDQGKHILHPSADTVARTFTIDSNVTVAYPIGTALTFVNQNAAGVVTIAITTDTMRLAGAGTVGSRTLAANGVATAIKLTATEWIISGTGLT